MHQLQPPPIDAPSVQRRIDDHQSSSTTSSTSISSRQSNKEWIKESWFEISPAPNERTRQDHRTSSASKSSSYSHGEESSNSSPPLSNKHYTPFLVKLHKALSDAAIEGLESILSWHPDGKGFRVHDTTLFAKHIIPKYFEAQSKYRSFQRQLNLYGFVREIDGKDTGYYRHSMFQRAKPELCQRMKINKNRGTQRTTSPASSAELQRSLSDSNVALAAEGTKSESPPSEPTRKRSSCGGDKVDTNSTGADESRASSLDQEEDVLSKTASRAPKRWKSDDFAVFAGRIFYPVDDRELRNAILQTFVCFDSFSLCQLVFR